VGSRFQGVVDVGEQDAPQATLVRDDDVVETLAANGPDQPLRIGILPRRVRSRDHLNDADRRCGGCRCLERGLAVAEEIAWGFIPRKSFTQLLGGPSGRGRVGDRDVHDAAALVGEYHQHKQQPARGGRHDEEVGGRDLVDVIRGKVRQVCDGGVVRRGMYFATVA
jgi:hypothetical protein